MASRQYENGKKEEKGVGVDWLLGLRRSNEHWMISIEIKKNEADRKFRTTSQPLAAPLAGGWVVVDALLAAFILLVSLAFIFSRTLWFLFPFLSSALLFPFGAHSCFQLV
jgi:hypothetical protein